MGIIILSGRYNNAMGNISRNPKIQKLLTFDRQLVDLSGAMTVLSWDQEVNMPKEGVELRANQLATLAGILHEHQVNPKIGELLTDIEGELASDAVELSDVERGYIRQIRRDFDQATKLPQVFVEDLALATSKGQQAWQQARSENSFSLFTPHLERIVALTKSKAEYLGYVDSPYDALLDQFEPGLTESELLRIFNSLREATVKILEKLQASNVTVNEDILHGEFPVATQEMFARELVGWLGYNLDAGRQDLSAHPFTISFGGGRDVRITTRVKHDQIDYAMGSTIHETGHAVYEQQVQAEFDRSSLAGGVSLGIHESQSRYFENQIGRSLPFWRFWYPKLQSYFSDQLPTDGLMDYYRAINKVTPSLIRTGADEVTYNLHIILRFEIERALIKGEVQVADLPDLWRAKMKEYLGVEPETDKDGVLQDVHWSHGTFGYFPTYTLGNLYAAQFAQKIREQLDVDALLEAGEFDAIRLWLNENIHQWGKVYYPVELVQRVTGESLNPDYFISYIKQKYGEMYGVEF